MSCGLTYRLEDIDLENCSIERGSVMVPAVKYWKLMIVKIHLYHVGYAILTEITKYGI